MDALLRGGFLAAIGLLLFRELGDPQFRRSLLADGARRSRNLGFLIASLLVMLVLPAAGACLRNSLPMIVRWEGRWLFELIGCFLAAEFLGWLLHYVKHRNDFLWLFHFQHHRESQYNIWLSTHTHAMEVLFSGLLTAAALCLLGFSTPVATIYLSLYSASKLYHHSARDYSLGPLDLLIISPRYHRLHHRVGSRCNYGTVLTLFDVLFRTACWPSAAASRTEDRYGVSEEEQLPLGFWPEMTCFLGRRRTVPSTAEPTARMSLGRPDGVLVTGPGEEEAVRRVHARRMTVLPSGNLTALRTKETRRCLTSRPAPTERRSRN